MTQEELSKQIDTLLQNSLPNIEELKTKIFQSGAINLDKYSNDDYTLSKAIVHIIFNELSRSWKPLTNKGIIEVSNIKKFI